jgi:hypothetical protein
LEKVAEGDSSAIATQLTGFTGTYFRHAIRHPSSICCSPTNNPLLHNNLSCTVTGKLSLLKVAYDEALLTRIFFTCPMLPYA